jgi:uncharacterized protein DUF5989
VNQNPRRGFLRRLASRAVTLAGVFRHFAHRRRFFLLPLVFVLLLAAVLLAATGGLAYVAPFLYTLF